MPKISTQPPTAIGTHREEFGMFTLRAKRLAQTIGFLVRQSKSVKEDLVNAQLLVPGHQALEQANPQHLNLQLYQRLLFRNLPPPW